MIDVLAYCVYFVYWCVCEFVNLVGWLGGVCVSIGLLRCWCIGVLVCWCEGAFGAMVYWWFGVWVDLWFGGLVEWCMRVFGVKTVF